MVDLFKASWYSLEGLSMAFVGLVGLECCVCVFFWSAMLQCAKLCCAVIGYDGLCCAVLGWAVLGCERS